jgi:phenylalanyl-tRNA synthetase alpha chain
MMTDALNETVASLHPLELRALLALSGDRPLAESDLVAGAGLTPEQARTAVQWLLARKLVRVAEADSYAEVTLSEIGKSHAERGIPENRILALLDRATTTPGEGPDGKAPITMAALATHPELAGEDIAAASGALKKLGVIEIGRGGAILLVDRERAQPLAELEQLIRRLASGPPVRLDALSPAEQSMVEENARRRGKGKGPFRLAERTLATYVLTEAGMTVQAALGDSRRTPAQASLPDEVSQLTPEMLRDGKWRELRFRRYNLGLKPSRVLIGRRHSYAEFLDQVRDKFVALGFEEMRGDLVENEFWNMDALFMPQFHSARDIHDVYYVKHPAQAREIEAPFGEKVADAHETGAGLGSRGWRYPFDFERARRLVLRSQGTALSARTLAKGAQVPGKYFAIARCFRHDQVDSTHASDFYQIEGIVLGERIGFRHLLGLLKLFAEEVAGAREFRFAPGYFPFTEPSVELHANHPTLGWMEFGGAGIFRPEVTVPLGVRVPVLAWGLGLDRMAMTALGINDIRQLFTTDLDFIRTSRALDLERRA